MIQGFSTIIQQDLAQIIDHMKGRGPQTGDQARRVGLAALRMFVTLGMALALIIAASSLTIIASAPVGAVLLVAWGVTLYALCHDIFIMAKNETEQMNLVVGTIATVKSLWQDFKDILQRKKSLDDAPRFSITEGTLFRPLWNTLLAQN